MLSVNLLHVTASQRVCMQQQQSMSLLLDVKGGHCQAGSPSSNASAALHHGSQEVSELQVHPTVPSRSQIFTHSMHSVIHWYIPLSKFTILRRLRPTAQQCLKPVAGHSRLEQHQHTIPMSIDTYYT